MLQGWHLSRPTLGRLVAPRDAPNQWLGDKWWQARGSVEAVFRNHCVAWIRARLPELNPGHRLLSALVALQKAKTWLHVPEATRAIWPVGLCHPFSRITGYTFIATPGEILV